MGAKYGYLLFAESVTWAASSCNDQHHKAAVAGLLRQCSELRIMDDHTMLRRNFLQVSLRGQYLFNFFSNFTLRVVLRPFNVVYDNSHTCSHNYLSSNHSLVMQQDLEPFQAASLRVNNALKLLRPKIEALNKISDIPYGSSQGIVAKYFSDYTVDKDEGATYSIDCAWTRAFQKCNDRLDIITRGRHGVAAIYNFFKEIKKSPQMTTSDCNFLEMKIQDLIGYVDQKYVVLILSYLLSMTPS